METQPAQAADASAACERCGSFDVLEIAGQTLCAGCVALCGCSCAGPSEDPN